MIERRVTQPVATSGLRTLGAGGVAWLAICLALVPLLRAYLTVGTLGDSAGCGTCLAWPVLASDAWLLAPGWGALALSLVLRPAWLGWGLRLCVLGLLLVMVADVAILSTLGLRLYLFDVFKFGGEGDAIGDFVAALLRSSSRGLLWAVAAALLATLFALFPQTRRPRLATCLALAALAALGAALASARLSPEYIEKVATLNLVQLHYAQSPNTPYSAAFVAELQQRAAAAAPVCLPGQGRSSNLIVVAVESLSSYQSKAFGGPLDLTPRLDQIAQSHTWFSRFYANGFSTDLGLIALLTGRAPVPAVGRYRSVDVYAGFEDPAHSIVAPLRAAGYESAFFTTGDLGFLEKSPWLEALGFDHWEGAEHPFYDGWPRAGFRAAEDRALYLRLLDWIRQRDASRPFFAFALTVQSHPPFVNKASGKLDEEAVFRAVDQSLGDFVLALEREKYFDDGILLITGDHRSMTPLHPAERRAFGERAFARVPLVVIGNSGLALGRVDQPFQQTDLLPTLADFTGSRVCVRPDQGRFLRGTPEPPAWILHARGDVRNRVDVYFGDHDGALLLDGDASIWVGDRPDDWQLIADEIHRDRLRRGTLDSDIPKLIRILGK